MRNQKGSHRIIVQKIEYRWRARGNDGYIGIGIWPVNNIGPYIKANLQYHETWIKRGEGHWSSAEDQIVVTNRIIRQIIEHAIEKCGYDPLVKGGELNLRGVDEVATWQGAVRATRKSPPAHTD